MFKRAAGLAMCGVCTVVLAGCSSTSTGVNTASGSAPATTSDTTGAGDPPDTTGASTATAFETTTTTAAPVDPIALFNNSTVTWNFGTGSEITLVDGQGNTGTDSAFAWGVAAGTSKYLAVGVIGFNSGGSGTFLTVAWLDADGAMQLAPSDFADRLEVIGASELDDGGIRVDYYERGANKALSAPGTIRAHLVFYPDTGLTVESPVRTADMCEGATCITESFGFRTDGVVNYRATPDRSGEPVGSASAGDYVPAVCWTAGEDVEGSNRWLLAWDGTYAWSGGVDETLSWYFNPGVGTTGMSSEPADPLPEC